VTFPIAKPGQTRVGFIGTGVMGASMAGHVLRAGYALTVFNRTRAKAESLLAAGARWADTPAEVARASDIVCAIVGLPGDVHQVFLGPDGVLAGTRRGMVLVDMTTSQPSLAREIAARAHATGAAALDAPVSGGDLGARNAVLSIMVGGDAEALATARPVLECMGKTIVHQGPAGAGQHTKMVNQILIAGALNGVCESLLYATKAGLDPTVVLQSVGGGAAASWQLANLGPRIIGRDFEPGFFAEHFIKDMAVALDEARRMDLPLAGLALVSQLFNAVAAQGWGRKGTQSLFLVLERLANLAPPASALPERGPLGKTNNEGRP
jgi:3-hydroxyisobutyrate dehydrogenase